ncbi:MAG: hypothetical protein LBU18_06235 [Treponema sp.]|jgi:hypothetical protein|nr:hypothetical protein [Treponema sp.]
MTFTVKLTKDFQNKQSLKQRKWFVNDCYGHRQESGGASKKIISAKSSSPAVGSLPRRGFLDIKPSIRMKNPGANALAGVDPALQSTTANIGLVQQPVLVNPGTCSSYGFWLLNKSRKMHGILQFQQGICSITEVAETAFPMNNSIYEPSAGKYFTRLRKNFCMCYSRAMPAL